MPHPDGREPASSAVVPPGGTTVTVPSSTAVSGVTNRRLVSLIVNDGLDFAAASADAGSSNATLSRPFITLPAASTMSPSGVHSTARALPSLFSRADL